MANGSVVIVYIRQFRLGLLVLRFLLRRGWMSEERASRLALRFTWARFRRDDPWRHPDGWK